MGAAKKLKELFFGTPAKEQPTPTKKKPPLHEVPKPNQTKYDKQEIEILKHKISRKFKEDPNAAKKAALIIEKMINNNKK